MKKTIFEKSIPELIDDIVGIADIDRPTLCKPDFKLPYDENPEYEAERRLNRYCEQTPRDETQLREVAYQENNDAAARFTTITQKGEL